MMEIRYQEQSGQKAVGVTYGQVEAKLKSLPVALLPEVYEYMRGLAEDAAVLALIEAGWNEPSRPVDELCESLCAELDA